MYKFQLTDKISTPIFKEELSEIHETRKQMIFSKLDKIFANNWQNLNCLDIACNEGYFSFELCKRGVKQVLGFDARSKNIEKANFVKSHLGYNAAQFFIDDINNIDPTKLGKFDLVLLLGLIYHVENPMLILRKARNLTKSICVIDTQITRFNEKITMGWGLRGSEKETIDSIGIVEEQDYQDNIATSVTGLSFIPNKSALFTMLRHAGFTEIEIIPPHKQSHEQYETNDRIMVLAK